MMECLTLRNVQEQISVEQYCALIDNELKDFWTYPYSDGAVFLSLKLNELDSWCSNEGFISDAWEAIKKFFKWLWQKIKDFIKFLWDLIARLTIWIGKLLHIPRELLLMLKALPPGANPVPNTHLKYTNNIVDVLSLLRVNGGSGISSANNATLFPDYHPVEKVKHEPIKNAINIKFRYPIALATCAATSSSTLFLPSVKYAPSNCISLLKVANILDSAFSEDGGYYQITGIDAVKLNMAFNNAETQLKGTLNDRKDVSALIEKFLDKCNTTLSSWKQPDVEKLNSLIGEFKKVAHYAQEKSLPPGSYISITDYERDPTEEKLRMAFQKMGNSLRAILEAINLEVRTCIHCNAKIVVGHQDLANSIQAIKMSDIYLMNYRKSYPFPSDLAKSLKEVFDFADMSREVPDSRKDDYEYILNAAKEYGKNTRFNIQEIVVMNPADKETRVYGNFYSAGGKTVIVPTSTARSSLRRSFLRTLVIGYSARRIVRPRAVLKEIANASKNEQLAAIIIHELKHSYDRSNEAIRREGHQYEDRAPEESSVHYGNYDDYGGKNGEYSADTGAAIAYRHFKDVFQKVVNYVDKLIVAMEKDIKDAEAKAQSSQ